MANEVHLLVAIRQNEDGYINRKGDVIIARNPEGLWGNIEARTHQIVSWPGENPTELESGARDIILAIINKKNSWGEPNSRVDFPFCEVVNEYVEGDLGERLKDSDGNDITRTSMTNRSVVHFNFENLDEQSLENILNPDVLSPIISCDAISFEIDERGIDKRKAEDRGLKLHRENTESNPVLHADTALRRDQTTDIAEFMSRVVTPIKSWDTQ